ncbi:MAG: hypothetical protein GXO82_04925 [Chlorobi bacterium]|nr:hypothetical protein [Chlorobiota bacterium]
MTSATHLRFGILGNPLKSKVVPNVCILVRYFLEKGIPFMVEKELFDILPAEDCERIPPENVVPREQIPEHCDVLVTFGGDGTLLTATHVLKTHFPPVLGVNLGKLGFLADVSPSDVIESVEMIRSGNYTVEQRMVLVGKTISSGEEFTALNDVVVAKSGTARVIRLTVNLNDNLLASFHADGIIIATPTGSTAYSLAVGGPIVVPHTEAITISPIGAHTLTIRPIVVPNASIIHIQASTPEGYVLVTADGQIRDSSDEVIEITVQKASHTVKLIKLMGSNYFDTLRTKLMWGKDNRDSPQ